MKKTINLDRILCPVVPSLGIDEGLECAVALARAYGAKLFVCHFVEDTSMVTGNVRTGVGKPSRDRFHVYLTRRLVAPPPRFSIGK